MSGAPRRMVPALIVAAVLASCGGDDPAGGESSTTAASTTRAVEATTTVAPSSPVESDLHGAWTSTLGTWTFNEDGSYSLEGDRSDGGRWRFSEVQQSITITSFSGDFCDSGSGGSFDVTFTGDRSQFTLDLKSDDCERLVFNSVTWKRQ